MANVSSIYVFENVISECEVETPSNSFKNGRMAFAGMHSSTIVLKICKSKPYISVRYAPLIIVVNRTKVSVIRIINTCI